MSGCQLAAWKCVKAQATAWAVKPSRDLRILVDVVLVVVVDELVPDRLAEDERHGHRQKAANGRGGERFPRSGLGRNLLFASAAAVVWQSVLLGSSTHSAILPGPK